MDIFLPLLREVSTEHATLYETLARWSCFCAEQGMSHARKAARLKAQHYGLSALILVLASAATIVSGLGGSFDEAGDLYFTTLALSATVTMLTGFSAVVDSAARRKDHLNSEFQYNVLGRDIAAHIVMYPPGAGRHSVSGRDVVSEFQRRLDNVESLAPPV